MTEPKSPEPLYLEDISVGDHWTSHEREVSGDDVADFAMLTGDHDPLHTDQLADSPFGQPIAHGLYGLSVLAGLSTEYPKVATRALVGLQDWTFDAPVFFGDSVKVRTEVMQIAPAGRRAGKITWLRELINQNGRVVQSGKFISLVAARHIQRTKASVNDTSTARTQ